MSDLLKMQRVDQRLLRLVGEFDISSAENVRNGLLESVGMLSSGTDLTLDLSGLRFIDCSGVHCLLQTAAALDDDGVLVLLEPRASVLRVFEMLRVQDAPHLQIRRAEANEPDPYQKRSNVSSISKRRVDKHDDGIETRGNQPIWSQKEQTDVSGGAPMATEEKL